MVGRMDAPSSAAELLRQALPGAQAIYLFGSSAQGTAQAGSDLDLAVLLARPLDPAARWRLAEEIAAAIGRDVDLIDLRAVPTVLQAQVLAADRLLFDGDPGARAVFEMLVLSDYARLNDERRGILDDVRARGTVHG